MMIYSEMGNTGVSPVSSKKLNLYAISHVAQTECEIPPNLIYSGSTCV